MGKVRHWSGVLVIAGCAVLGASNASACAGRQLKLVVGLAPGGGIDALARVVGQRLTERKGWTVIVDNRAGAGGNLAAAFVSRSAPDGCTLLVTGNNHTINPFIYTKPGYALRDFAPVIRAVDGTSVLLAHPAQPFHAVADLVAFAKAHPGQVAYSSSGVGFPNHLAMELFVRAAGVQLTHVPYGGSAPALNDAVSGMVQLSISSAAAVLPFVEAGKLRPLAVSAPNRWPTLPNVPTMREAGYPSATSVTWIGLLAPAATPLQLREDLNAELQSVLTDSNVRMKLRALGYETAGGSIRDFDTFLQEDARSVQGLASGLKLKPD